MSEKSEKFIDKYIVGKTDWILEHKEVIAKLLDEYENEQLNIPIVVDCDICACGSPKVKHSCKNCGREIQYS